MSSDMEEKGIGLDMGPVGGGLIYIRSIYIYGQKKERIR